MNRKFTLESLESRTLLAISGLPDNIGGAKFDMGKRILATADGGYVCAGIFSGKVDFDLSSSGTFNLTSLSDTDIYVAKYSSTGAFQWAKQIGGYGMQGGMLSQNNIDIAADPYRAGTIFYNGVGADPRSTGEYLNDMAIAPDGGIVLVGSFYDSVDFNPGSGRKVLNTSEGEWPDGFVLKLKSNGDFFFVRQIGGPFTEMVSAVDFDSSGSIFLTGMFSRTVQFLPGVSSFTRTANGRADGFAMKLGYNGRIRWVNTFGGIATVPPERDAGNDIAVDPAGNVYVAGTYFGQVDFDPSPTATASRTSVGLVDGFLAKYDNRGAFKRVISYGTYGFDGLTNVVADSSGGVIVSGYFQGNDFDADPGPGTALLDATPINLVGGLAFTDVFVEKLDANLQLQWVRQLAGTGYELADQIKLDSAENIVMSGSFYGSAVFGITGPTLTSVAGYGGFADANDPNRSFSYDPFLWKLDPTGTTTVVVTWGSAGDEMGAGLDIAPDDSMLFTGRFKGSTDFNPGPPVKQLRSEGLGNAWNSGFDQTGAPLF